MSSLPPNLQLLRELLLSQDSMAPTEVQLALQAEGIHLDLELIQQLPQRHPTVFARSEDGDLTLAVGKPTSTELIHDDEDTPTAWWRSPAIVEPLPLDKVWVFDLETTGLEVDRSEIWEIGVVNLGTGEQLSIRVDGVESDDLPPLAPGDVTLAVGPALQKLSEVLSTGDAVLGQNIISFDIPMVENVARRVGVQVAIPDVRIDLLELCLLLEPNAIGRTLMDLCEAYGVTNDDSHRALSDALATARVTRAVLDRIDRDDASWRLVGALLAQTAHPIGRLLPTLATPPEDLKDSLHPVLDPLCHPEDADANGRPARSAAIDGIAALRTHGYTDRRQQNEMAVVVGETLDDAGRLIVEAPTGTGKTFAYLLPAAAAAHERPVVIATATKALQSQLYDDAKRLKDLGLLDVPFRHLQGVSNYICTREVADALQHDPGTAEEALALAVAIRALSTIPGGSWTDVTDYLARGRLPYRDRRATLRTDSAGCDRRECEWVASCPLYTKLDGAQDRPGILAVNHALLASWINLSEQGRHAPGQVLEPNKSDLILDEAHELEDTLTAAWTERLDEIALMSLVWTLRGRRGPLRLLRRIERRSGLDLGTDQLRALASPYSRSVEELTSAVRTYVHEFGGVGSTTTLIGAVVRRRKEFNDISSKSLDVRTQLSRLRKSCSAIHQRLAEAEGRIGAAARRSLTAIVERIRSLDGLLDHLRLLPQEHEWVYELSDDPERIRPWAFEKIPIRIDQRFRDGVVERVRSTTLTSATLGVWSLKDDERSFDYFCSRLGLQLSPEAGGFQTRVMDSPFDFSANSVVILTNHLPLPIPATEREFCEEAARDQVGFFSLSGGKSLVLFAARARMDQVVDLVERFGPDLEARGVRILKQHREAAREIAQRFRTEVGTVLYGLRSYWEGFDAPGETLSYLFIEKPPYPHPSDPIVAARQRAIADVGGDPFLEYIVPKTAILLAQGYGRLLRTETDRGAALILDRRMQSPNGANRILLNSLPGTNRYDAEDREDAWSKAIGFVTGQAPNLEDALLVRIDEIGELLEGLRIAEGEDPAPKLREAARRLYDIDCLRPEQVALMEALLEGRDVVGILPTGSGKSICFQLPALLRSEDRPTVVVSPLVALIKDQVDDLRSRRGLRPVQGITGKTPNALRNQILREVRSGKVRLLYVSPERFARDRVLQSSLEQIEMASVVVDEAHCVSTWGHDFRPEFREVTKAAAGRLRGCKAAFTATATKPVEEDIIAALEMTQPLVVRAKPDRANLRFWVRRCSDERERARLLTQIALSDARPGIVYVSRRALAEELSALLRRYGVASRHYHAGLVPEQREAIQDDFFNDSTRVIVATKAFGMGINKSDIGWVVHYDLPESLESYVQEAGRAGREPRIEAECVLLFTNRDIKRRQGLIRANRRADGLLQAQSLLKALQEAPKRGDDAVMDPEELAEAVGSEPDDLNVLVSWLERIGTLTRLPDCAARGWVDVGVREPIDPAERRRFRELTATLLKSKPGVRRQIDFLALPDGLDADELEADLIRWTLDNVVTYSATQRLWRLRPLQRSVDEQAFRALTAEWARSQDKRLGSMINYAEAGTCRRSLILRHFGDDPADCSSDHARCDNCADDPSPWERSELEFADPDEIVDIELALLQAVAWSTLRQAKYSERNLLAAVRGDEVLHPGPRPLPAGLFGCPQFGAVRFIRSGQRRLEEAVESLMGKSLISRERTTYRVEYDTLVATGQGLEAVGART